MWIGLSDETLKSGARKTKRRDLSSEYTKVCSHCGVNLHTKKEYEDGQCARCQDAYEEEMYNIYGDEW